MIAGNETTRENTSIAWAGYQYNQCIIIIKEHKIQLQASLVSQDYTVATDNIIFYYSRLSTCKCMHSRRAK